MFRASPHLNGAADGVGWTFAGSSTVSSDDSSGVWKRSFKGVASWLSRAGTDPEVGGSWSRVAAATAPFLPAHSTS